MMLFTLLLQSLLLWECTFGATKTYLYLGSFTDNNVAFNTRLFKNLNLVEIKVLMSSTTLTSRNTTDLTNIWVGVGVSKTGKMSDSELVIGFLDAGGNSVVDGYLPSASGAPRGVNKGSNANVLNGKIQSVDGGLQLIFNRTMLQNGPFSQPVQITNANNIVYAFGPVTAGVPQTHNPNQRGIFQFNYQKANIVEPYNAFLLKAHGVCMLVAWGIFLNNGILMARFGKIKFNNWFPIHRASQLTGVALVISGYVFTMVEHKGFLQFTDIHHFIGHSIIVLVVIQVILGYISYTTYVPNKPIYVLQDRLHWYTGRVLMVLASFNMGFALISYFSSKVVLAVLFVVWLLMYLALYFFLERYFSVDPDTQKFLDREGNMVMEDFLGRRIDAEETNYDDEEAAGGSSIDEKQLSPHRNGPTRTDDSFFLVRWWKRGEYKKFAILFFFTVAEIAIIAAICFEITSGFTLPVILPVT